MIDLENYSAAISWLNRSLAQLELEPSNSAVRLSALHSFEVTYNISESLLRQAYSLVSDDKDAAYLSTRELIRQASDEGLTLSSPMQWMQYGLALESIRENMVFSGVEESFDLGVLSPTHFMHELTLFARCLEKRLATYA